MPSLYEATAQTGDVSSSDFTTLYNASGLTVPNAGAGAVTGNLNVSGNLTVQGTSNLIGAVTIGNTLSTPNYTFPLPDGSTDQVLVTDGNGNLYWTDVTAIPGAAYQIEATTTTGGANLTLLDSAGGQDSVKFASGTNTTVTRTNANTITIDANSVTYTIDASATTGGANLNLVGSDSTTDTVKFAGSAHITVTQTDANTITISTDADNIPDGTADGQVLVWESGAWTANNVVTATTSGILTAEFKNNTATTASSFAVRRNTGSTPYTTGTDALAIFQFDSDSQPVTNVGVIGFAYNATDPAFGIATSTNNFSTSTSIAKINSTDVNFNGTNLVLNYNHTGAPSSNATITVERGSSTDATITWNESTDTWELSNDALVAGDLAVNGGDITTTSTTGNLFNTNATVVNIGNAATTEVNLGNIGAGRVQIKPDTIVGANTTQNVFNTVATTVNAFGAATAINMGAATGLTTIGHDLSINGTTLKINADGSGSPVDNYIYFNGTNESLKWNQSDTRFEFSDQLYISQAEPAAVFERRVTAAEVSPSEAKGAVRLLERVTDAVSNATDNAGPSVTFGRTYGTSGGTERQFASMGSVWYGTTNKARLQFNWTTDDFTEPTPGVFPQTYTLLSLDSDYATFFNNSLYVDYAYVNSTKTATSITGGNTLVFGSAHGYSAGDRILYQSATQNGLTQSTYYYVLAAGLTTTQCRVSNQSGGTATTLTNGTGLTLTFAQVTNRVGINTTSPSATLDVNGDANVSGNITTGGITAGNITVGVVNDNTISTTSGVLDIVPATGSDMTLSTVTAANPVTLARTTANTATPTRAAKFQLASTGTPAVGIGTRVEFSTQTGASTFVAGAYIETESTNIGSGTEAFDMNFQLMNAGSLSSKATLTSAGNFSIVGDLTVNGNDIKSSTGTALTLSGADVTVQGDLTVNGNDIKSSTATALTLSGADVDVQGDLTVTGNDIKSSGGTTAITMNGADVAIAGNLGVDIAATNVTVQIGSEVSMITAQTITTSTATVALTTSTRSSMSGIVTIKDNVTSALHTVNFTVLRNGATALLTTYGELYTAAALANFTADVSGSVIRLLATPVSANNTTFNAVRTAIS